jgi:hypothetical protein
MVRAPQPRPGFFVGIASAFNVSAIFSPGLCARDRREIRSHAGLLVSTHPQHAAKHVYSGAVDEFQFTAAEAGQHDQYSQPDESAASEAWRDSLSYNPRSTRFCRTQEGRIHEVCARKRQNGAKHTTNGQLA